MIEPCDVGRREWAERELYVSVTSKELVMDASEYRAALSALGFSQLAAGRWLGVSPKTAQRYAVDGPSGPASVAIRMALAYGLQSPPTKAEDR